MDKVSRVKFDILLNGVPAELPKYRVYVDNDLFVERTFVWDSNLHYIQENLVLVISPGPHVLRIEKLPSDANFTVRNCLVDDVPFEMNASTLEQTFNVLA